MSKNGNTPPLFKILFFLKYLDLFKTDFFFCAVQIKDSCIVDIKLEILLAFLTFDLRLRS